MITNKRLTKVVGWCILSYLVLFYLLVGWIYLSIGKFPNDMIQDPKESDFSALASLLLTYLSLLCLIIPIFLIVVFSEKIKRRIGWGLFCFFLGMVCVFILHLLYDPFLFWFCD